jgi:hypothetical protein
MVEPFKKEYAMEDAQNKDTRKYREVLCPVCEKKYMTYVYSEDGYDYAILQGGKKLYGWADKCPKCDTWLFVEDHVLEGRKMDEYQVENVGKGYKLR